MSRPTVGALFAGYGGIELALHDVFDAKPLWFSEFDPAPSKILAHRFPDVPNLGDVTKIKWTPDCPVCGHLTSLYWVGEDKHRAYWCREHGEFDLSIRHAETERTGVAIAEPVDIITGGSPCQDLSHAGKRKGMKAGTRSGLWASMCDAIDIIRPALVVWENVRGALSAEATAGDVESCDLCVGDGPRVHLRALGRVLGDLAELGYDAAWTGLRAADVGAPHGRFRIFVLAWPAADARGQAGEQRPGLRPDEPSGHGRGLPARSDRPAAGASVTLLPTPAVNDMGRAYTPETWDAWTERMKAAHGNGNGHGASLSIEALRMLPTPRTKNNENRQSDGYGGVDGNFHGLVTGESSWGTYAPAVARWEALTRTAPEPTEQDWERWEKAKSRRLASTLPVGMRGSIRFIVDGPPRRLSPAFVEWLMGLPAGWVTDVPDVSRNDQLKALGNGVVPQQCAAAVRHLLEVRAHATKAVA